MSSIGTISHENVVAYAKDILNPVKCDWQLEKDLPCPVILGCWSLLHKHYLKHCYLQNDGHAKGMCRLPRCNIRVHSSIQLLQEHVEIAHLSRVSLPCPIKDCTPTFIHPNQLIDHFHDTHEKRENFTRVSSGFIKPSWQPFVPTTLLLPLPPPTHASCGLSPEVVVPRSLATPTSRTGSQAGQVQLVQKRRMEKRLTMVAELHMDAEDNQQSPSNFPALGRFGDNYSMGAIIWERPSHLKMDVARPRNMSLHISSGDPPLSIHYKVFAKQVVRGLEDVEGK